MVRLIFFIFSVAPKMVFCMILGEDSALTLRAATDVERGRLPSRRETRLGGLLVGGSTLGMGSPHPVKAVLEVVLRAAGFPAGADLWPCPVVLFGAPALSPARPRDTRQADLHAPTLNEAKLKIPIKHENTKTYKRCFVVD
jgi:hypothetical protein